MKDSGDEISTSSKLFSGIAPPLTRSQTSFRPAPKKDGAPFIEGVGWLVRKEKKGRREGERGCRWRVSAQYSLRDQLSLACQPSGPN